MRKQILLTPIFATFAILCVPRDDGQGGRPIPPGVRDADKQINAPVEPPPTIKQKPVNVVAVRQEAEELAKLSAAIPSQVDHATQGQLPKDLADQLKRIEKLAKHLRSEVAP